MVPPHSQASIVSNTTVTGDTTTDNLIVSGDATVSGDTFTTLTASGTTNLQSTLTVGSLANNSQQGNAIVVANATGTVSRQEIGGGVLNALNCVGNGSNAVCYGPGANATGINTTAIGAGATAATSNSSIELGATALGAQACAEAINATAIGYGSAVSGENATAIGTGSNAAGSRSIALGQNASTSALSATAIERMPHPHIEFGCIRNECCNRSRKSSQIKRPISINGTKAQLRRLKRIAVGKQLWLGCA